MNVVALRWSCVWGGKDKDDTGWRRFLVFARLTKQRGKTDYVALFTYFSFKGWVRIVFAEGPRVVINTFTLASVFRADLVPKGQLVGLSMFSKFIENIEHLYMQNKMQVIILCSMTFTTVLWVFAMLQLLLACILFIFFLWHLIGDDSLRKYCKDRIDKRVSEIVNDNHKKGLRKDIQKAGLPRAPTIPVPAMVALEKPSYEKPNYTISVTQRQPTIPNLPEMERGRTPKPLSRAPTSSTVASSMRPGMGRSHTIRSNDSFDSNSGLVPGQAPMGYDERGRTREYTDRQQQWGPPPPVPYLQGGNGGSDGRRTPAQSNSGRSDGGRTPAPREVPNYPMQNIHSQSSQNGRLPFAADRPGRQQTQDEYGNMPLREQGQSWEQNQGQYDARPGPPTISGSGRSNYDPAQGRFPTAVRAGDQWQQERFPIAARPQDPQQQQYYNDQSPQQTQSPIQYYNNGDPPQQMESPYNYYSQQEQEQQEQEQRGHYPPQQQQQLQQLPQKPQPTAYEYFPPSQQQQQPQFYQQPITAQPKLSQLRTQNIVPITGGYKRPVYTPASAIAPTTANNFDFSDLPMSNFLGQGDSAQTRSATTPQRAPLEMPIRSATARPDVGRGDFGVIRPIQRSATSAVREATGGVGF
ncbi:Potassium transporter [Maublancomyces gigas]|uniref:Potassium transporter n=1 Tax=Discina gigas TaxID=1032678 RepID=A0ABR3GX99_9PEZI